MSEDVAGPVRHETTHEPSDVSPRLVLALLALVAAALVISAIILALVFHGELSPPSNAPSIVPPQPRLQVDEHADLKEFRARVEKQLNSYGWVDRQGGIVHIPIAAAMQRAAANGFPDWPGNKR